MTTYNYMEAMKEDIKDYIRDNFAEWEIADKLADRDEWEEELNDQLWTVDSVTGNASGSYTFNAYRAEEYLCHNLDLLAEAAEEFGSSTDILRDGAESCDVTIRCYLLNQATREALNEIEEEFEEVTTA